MTRTELEIKTVVRYEAENHVAYRVLDGMELCRIDVDYDIDTDKHRVTLKWYDADEPCVDRLFTYKYDAKAFLWKLDRKVFAQLSNICAVID